MLAAAIIGSRTFDSWRRQKLSERRIEQAERILTATYKVRRSLSIVRNPMMFPHEIAAAEESLKASGEWDKIFGGEDERRRHQFTQAYYNRLNTTVDSRRTLQECQPMARALFGEALEQAIEILNHQFWMVKVSVDAHHSGQDKYGEEIQKEISGALYEGYPSPEKNKMNKLIAEQIKIIEDICVPVLKLEGDKKNRS